MMVPAVPVGMVPVSAGPLAALYLFDSAKEARPSNAKAAAKAKQQNGVAKEKEAAKPKVAQKHEGAEEHAAGGWSGFAWGGRQRAAMQAKAEAAAQLEHDGNQHEHVEHGDSE